MAMQLITDVVQSTGYYTNPLVNSAGSAISGRRLTDRPLSPRRRRSWAITPRRARRHHHRYQTAGTTVGDNAINCTGNASTTPANFVNQITVNTATNYLTCTLWLNGAQQPTVSLVPGITDMSVLYGVETGNGTATNSVDAYITADLVTAGNYWTPGPIGAGHADVHEPMVGQPGQTANPTVSFTRNIAVMYKTGVTT